MIERDIDLLKRMRMYSRLDKNATVKVHNRLITAKHNLTLEEIKLMDILTLFIQTREIKSLGNFKLPVLVIRDFYREKRNEMRSVISSALEGLASKLIIVQEENNEGLEGARTFKFISRSIYKSEGDYFEISISGDLKPYLYPPDGSYTEIPIRYIYQSRSRYALVLYKLLKMHEKEGYWICDVYELRELLGLSQAKYKRFADFNRLVLNKVVRRITSGTDLRVDYMGEKVGRRVIFVGFKIERKRGTNPVKERGGELVKGEE